MFSTRFRRGGGAGALLAGLLLSLAILLSLSTGAQGRAAPSARRVSTHGCNLAGAWGKLGPTYVESLSVRGTNCGVGERTIKAYNHCRLSHGGVKGYCHERVIGFSCRERRYSGSSIQFIAKVSCTKPRQLVAFTYSENT
jgi:hypothetical protein